ncbi:MAG: leucine-rich repeat protein, partial [Firmicutes bacterium]|nr:leucine-rich repeat protein [Bacillota bacterium]
MSLKETCDLLGIEVPENFRDRADEMLSLCFHFKKLKPGDTYLMLRSYEGYSGKGLTTKDQYDEAIAKGAKLIIMSRDYFEDFDGNEDEFPVILIDDARNKISNFFKQLKGVHGHTVMITGSIGKTTTKDLCATVAEKNFKYYANSKNTNTLVQAARHVFSESLNPREVFIQECGMGYRESVELASEMLEPDIFILTNIYKHHILALGSYENIIYEKTSPDKHMPPHGVIITNYDEEVIRNHDFQHRVISFGVNNEDVDYRAINLNQQYDILSFDVLERETGIKTHLEVNLLGEHNAYNILAAYVLGRYLGVAPEKLSEDFKTFKPSGLRQNVRNIGGVVTFVDCYNVSEESIRSSLEAGLTIPLEEGARRIALVGGENKLGKNVKSRSYEFGKTLADLNYDKFLFCGTEDTSMFGLNRFGDGEDVARGFQEVSDTPSEYLDTVEDIMEAIQKNVRRGDLMVLKGVWRIGMPVAMDKLFGTSLSYGFSQLTTGKTRVKGNRSRGYYIPAMDVVEVTRIKANNGHIEVPDEIEGHPVTRISPDTFGSDPEITSVHFGNSLRNISAELFKNCTGLTEINIPGNVKMIEENAFNGCIGLESVSLEEGVLHISEGAFADCGALKTISIPDSVGMIEENAFENCDLLKIRCSKDSFAR